MQIYLEKNSLVCSIHFLPVLFLAAETIWCVVIEVCGGIFPQLQQDSLTSETTYSSLVEKKERAKLYFTETQSSVKAALKSKECAQYVNFHLAYDLQCDTVV